MSSPLWATPPATAPTARLYRGSGMWPRLGAPDEPQRPQSERPPTTRPYSSHGFVKDTALRLADDAAKMSMTASTTASATSSRALCASPLDDVTDANLWRRSFLIEAAECIRSLQAVFDSANITHFASRFDDWRKVDLKATTQMQHHVKQLSQLNKAIEEFLTRCATPDEFVNFKGSLVAMTHCVDELTTTREELVTTVDTIAERAANKALAAWQAEIRDFSAQLGSHMGEQRDRWAREEEREQAVDAQIDAMRNQVARLDAEIQQQRVQVASCETTTKESSDEVIGTLRDSVRNMLDVARSTAEATKEQLGDTFRQVAAEDLRALQALLGEVLVGPILDAAKQAADEKAQSGSDAEQPVSQPGAKPSSVAEAINSIDHRLYVWQNDTIKEATHWRQTAAKLEASLEERERDLEQLTELHKQTTAKAEESEARGRGLAADLQLTSHALEAATAVSMSNAMRRLKAIEERGTLTMNRHSGELKLVKALDFSGANFGDVAAAEKSLTDLAELLLIYQTPVELQVLVKVSKGNPKAQCEQLAIARVELVKSQLEQLGVPGDTMSVKGAAGAPDGLVVQIEKGLFVEPPQPQARGGSRSPSRARR